MSQIVLYFLHSTSVLSFYVDVVLTVYYHHIHIYVYSTYCGIETLIYVDESSHHCHLF